MKLERSPQRDFCGDPMSTIMLDVRRYSPAEALEFYGEVMHRSPHEHFVFLLGPPKYLSRTLPDEVTVDDVSHEQWGETVKRFLTAA